MRPRAWKLGLVGLVAATPLLCANAAQAITANIHIHGTGTDGVYVRSAPNTSGTRLRWMAEGTSPDYNCFTYGENINGVSVWFSVNYSGVTGYYASYYDDSVFHSEAELTSKYGIPKCGAAAPAPTPAPAPSPAPTTTAAAPAPPAAASSPTPAPSITVSVGGQNGCANCRSLDVAVHNFPTGTYTYECHDNSGSGGSDRSFYSYSVAVTDPNQSSWPGLFCYDSAPYSAYVIINGVRSNAVSLGTGVTNAQPADQLSAPAAPTPASPAPAQPAPAASSSAPTSPGTGAIADGGVIYYSPYGGDTVITHGRLSNGTTYAPAPADGKVVKVMHPNDWAKCQPTPQSGVSAGGLIAPYKRVTRLASWSEPRNLPFAFLQSGPNWKGQINYVLMYDPGTPGDFSGSKCPSTSSAASTLLSWLKQPGGHHLTILAGNKSAEGNYGGVKQLLSSVAKADAATRKLVVVCPYPKTKHEDIWIHFRGSLLDPVINKNTCPGDTGISKPTGWSP